MQDDLIDDSSGSINREGEKALKLLNAVFPQPDESTRKSNWTLPVIPGIAIGNEIGRGTFGIVYEAVLESTQEKVAVKIARPEVSQSEQLKQRFLRECRVAQNVKHPGLVPIYDSGESNETLYLVMEFCEGVTLGKFLFTSGNKLDYDQIASVIYQVAVAVGYGHSQGIVHRDLKPANIIVNFDSNGLHRVKVVDFGLAFGIEDSMAQTQSSVMLGTPLYMSPEQVTATRDQIGPATDVFAIGSIFYQCLVGKAPFAADSIPRVFELIRRSEPTALSILRPDIPKSMETICLKCLAHSPSDRYPTGLELAEDIQRWQNREPILARSPTIWTKLRRWLRKPDRISEFGLGLLAINSLVLGWAILNYPIALLIDSVAQQDISSDQMFLPVVAIIIPVHGALWWSSYKIYRNLQTHRGVMLHLLFTLLIAVASIGTICFASQSSSGNLDRFERVAALGLMSSFAECQSILLILLLTYSPISRLRKANRRGEKTA